MPGGTVENTQNCIFRTIHSIQIYKKNFPKLCTIYFFLFSLTKFIYIYIYLGSADIFLLLWSLPEMIV